MGSEKISNSEMQRARNGSRTAKGQPSLAVTCLALVLLIAFTYLLTDCLKQPRMQESIRSQIALKNAGLAASDAVPSDLARQLEEAESEHQALLSPLSAGSASSTEVIAGLLETASACNLKSSNLHTARWSEKTVGHSSYSLIPLDLDLQGDESDISAFIGELEAPFLFPSLAIDSLTITGQPAGEGASQTVSAHLRVFLLARLESMGEGNK
jgi:hypothetical protein